MTDHHSDVLKGIRTLRNNAKSGQMLSQYELYERYLNGRGVGEVDEAQANNYLELLYENIKTARFTLRELKLYQFRRYQALTIDFDEKLTVIIGENGSGKTTIVESIARVLTWFSSRILKANNRGLHIISTDIREPAKDYAEINTSFSLNDQTNFELSLARPAPGWDGEQPSNLQTSTQLGALYRLLASDVDKGAQVQLPVFAYYAVERNFSPRARDGLESGIKTFFTSRFSAYQDASVSARVDLFLTRYVQLFNLAETVGGTYETKLQLANKAITTIVPFIKSIGVDRSSGNDDVVVENFGSRISFLQLSQGQKTLAALVGDLAVRMMALNPAMENPLHAQGIVLIDEIELHLHPKWQQGVLLNLADIFKQVQFIVTTHSPHVLSTVDQHCIRMLRFDAESNATAEKPTFQTKGVISSDVLEQLMETCSVPDVEEAEWITRYQSFIGAGLWESNNEAKQLREKLNRHFGKNHPVIEDLQAQIRLQELKRRVQEKKG